LVTSCFFFFNHRRKRGERGERGENTAEDLIVRELTQKRIDESLFVSRPVSVLKKQFLKNHVNIIKK